MHRRRAIETLLALLVARPAAAAPDTVATVIGSGTAGYSDQQVNNPYGVVIGPGGALVFCDLDNQRIRRLDLRTRRTTTIAGSGRKGYAGDGGPARLALLAGPKGLAWWRGRLLVADTESHVVRGIDLRTGIIDTVLGTGQRGDGPEPDPRRCALARPHGVFVDRRGTLYVGDSEAHRIRAMSVAGWPR